MGFASLDIRCKSPLTKINLFSHVISDLAMPEEDPKVRAGADEVPAAAA